MKTKHLFIAIVATLLVGCGSLLHKQDVPPQVISQPILKVDPNTGASYVAGYRDVELPGGQAFTVNTNVTAGLNAVRDTLNAAAAVPSPLTPFLAFGASLMTAVSGGLLVYAKKKSGQLTNSDAALSAAVTVIEVADDAAKLKAAVTKAATANGSQDYLHEKVKNL
jgi:hypothetical protein